ncbi:hypothetical protein [Paeniglutamicibacter sp. NPDC091659]|uniref:hypothetical protein n=1 Tax=Paeniglutamicibacter sp. NPDC091659 TaxID=3364389 RepID=UPI0038261818
MHKFPPELVPLLEKLKAMSLDEILQRGRAHNTAVKTLENVVTDPEKTRQAINANTTLGIGTSGAGKVSERSGNHHAILRLDEPRP